MIDIVMSKSQNLPLGLIFDVLGISFLWPLFGWTLPSFATGFAFVYIYRILPKAEC
jgi:hypothetical protein